MTAESRRHVVHVIYRLDVGGLENGMVNLVNRMPAERYRHTILCLAGYSESFRQRITRRDVAVLSVDKRPGKDLAAYGRVWRLLRHLRPDVVHTRNLGTVDMQWIAAAAGVRVRVHGEHGWEATDPKGRNPRSLMIRRACRPVIHSYVPMSCDIAGWLATDVRVDPARIRQLYSGVDAQKFHPPARGAAADEPHKAISPAGLPAGFLDGNPVVIGTVGRLDPVKNQAILLEALRGLSDQGAAAASDVRLVIAGDGPLRDSLEAEAARLGVSGRVWFAGSRSDTPDVLRALDVFVLPSLNEGVSNTILEAMATGLPVVAARVGGNPELVLDGVTGTLYDPSAPGGAEEALLRYVTDPALRRTHGAAGLARAVQKFSLDAMVQRYVDLYDELLARAPATGGRRSATAAS
jgi:sugar transferase (PEP-CTERM/EpsH1 system associated)